ncbi:MAG: ATP-binding cassette domain-containing protein, partial [Spirochaetota bacterium]
MIRVQHLVKSYSKDERRALGDRISGYSHGMKQKVAIIAALLHDPEVFILDEPIVGLDPRSSFLLKETMRKQCTKGKTVFYSTRVMEVAERLCDRVGIIRHGELIAEGPLDALRDRAGKSDATLESLFLELTHAAAEATQSQDRGHHLSRRRGGTPPRARPDVDRPDRRARNSRGRGRTRLDALPELLGMAVIGLETGIPDLPFYVATVGAWVIVFLLGFPAAISALYFSKDTRLLATLPVRSPAIVGAHA